MEGEAEVSEGDKETHHVRITDHTKIRQYVKFCLGYLTENPRAMLVLHTLPNAEPKQAEDAGEEPAVTKKRKLPSPTEDIPRLISVAEIIKREFVALVASNKAGAGNPSGTVLHQYNVLECLPTSETNQTNILSLLEGRNHLKKNSVPYMKIYLTTQLRNDLEKSGATYQEPLHPPKKSKSARARERKKQGKKRKSDISAPMPPAA